ncbi:uncharacterized protein LOC106155746 [Lingula anatina]|uniref:Uncharacterized protein LOC106155746 n=1 Tax=Lingula anatina TaxID=7574 RepID=A0A1S3HL39_LINAN|nr:uncharacterized protein LOC106155746 [Lingula anatina]|eukprot:XP_013386176.1 uncharacterized protein LOC106155746 [Lingula anatina]
MGVSSEEVGLESTTIFSHAKTGADMEFTTCVGSLSLGLNSVQGQKTASNQSKMDENFSVNTSPGKRAAVKTTEPTDAHRHETDKTIHFSSTGEEDMEMTVVTGLVLPGRESKEIEGMVTSGSAEENSEMEFTVSVEELKGSFATKPSAPSADDKTVVFDPNSNPEGDYEDDDDSISFKTTNSMADATKHTTKGMDFTTCVGNIEVNSPPCKTSQSPDCNSSSEEADRMPTTMDNKSDATIVINSNCQLTNNMDFTTCIGEVDSPAPEGLEADSHTKFNPLAEQTGCMELTSCVGNKSSQGLEQDDGQKEPAEKSMSHRDNVNKSNVSQREQLEGQSYTSPSHPQREMSSREFSSDGSSTRGTCSVQGEIEARSRSVTPTDGQGGTYTIQKLCTMGDVLTEYSEPASKPPTSSTSEFGILEESIPDMDHTEEMQNTVSENAHSFSKSSYSSGSDTEQLQMTLSKTSMLSVIDEKAEQSMAVSSVDGKITVEDLMMMCGVTFCTKSTRRSTMAPVSMAPPESLQEYLELGMIVQPELETMDWACNWLTQHIEKLRSTVAQVEERLNKNNPEIFEEVRVASKEEMKELKSKIRALVLACRKNSKAKFKQWKGKAVKTILEALQEEEDSIQSCLSELEEACTSLDEQRVKLNEVDAYITEQLRASENLQLPDEQDIQQYVDIVGNLNVEKQVLEEKQMEVNEITKKKDALELEYDVMHKELGRIRLEKKEMMVPCSTSEDLLAKSQCLDRMQRLNEWIIEDIDDYRAKFSWLYDSLLMTVNYGTKTCDPVTGGSTEHRNIADVQFTSKLGDDVACYAHLAHAMILRTIRDEELIKTFPTTEHLPQMMRSVSEVVTGARILSAEVERIQLTHVVKVAETSVTIEFSHLDAFCKFVLTFHLKPGEYPYTPVEWNFKHCIGDIRQEEVSQIIGNQKLGIGYLSRAVDALDKFLDQRVSRKTDNFD